MIHRIFLGRDGSLISFLHSLISGVGWFEWFVSGKGMSEHEKHGHEAFMESTSPHYLHIV